MTELDHVRRLFSCEAPARKGYGVGKLTPWERKTPADPPPPSWSCPDFVDNPMKRDNAQGARNPKLYATLRHHIPCYDPIWLLDIYLAGRGSRRRLSKSFIINGLEKFILIPLAPSPGTNAFFSRFLQSLPRLRWTTPSG